MRYYTKKWYHLMQEVGGYTLFKKIPDREYNDFDIKALYDKKIKNEIRREKKFYNEKPTFLSIDELLIDDDCLENWIILDEENNQIHIPQSKEEIIAYIKNEEKQAMEKYQSRPPFNENEIVNRFQECYKNKLKMCKQMYPSWLINNVDHRLISLGYLPENIYNQYKKECKQKEKEFNKINKQALKTMKKENISEDILNALSLHDASLLSLRKKGLSLIMIVRKDGLWPEETPYREVIFKNAKIIEKDQGLRSRKYKDSLYYYSSITFLYDEIYTIKQGYEVHIMFSHFDELKYLTISCEDIKYRDGVKMDS